MYSINLDSLKDSRFNSLDKRMLSDEQRKILGRVLLPPFLVSVLVWVVSLVLAFPKILVLVGLTVATITGIFLLMQVRGYKMNIIRYLKYKMCNHVWIYNVYYSERICPYCGIEERT